MDDSKLAGNPQIIVLSGPSGVGKDAVISKMREKGSTCHFAITTTTRKIRKGEVHGRDYFFVSKSDFQKLISSEGLLEWAEVYGNHYGVPKKPVSDALSRGLDVVLKIDVQGARTIKKIAPNALFIFLSPASPSDLENRLRYRMTESHKALKVRLETAVSEMSESTWFDYEVENANGKLEEAASQIEKLITNNRLTNTTKEYFS